MRNAIIFIALFVISTQAFAAGTVSGTVSISIEPALVMVLNPSSALLACEAPAGTLISAISVAGGDGKPSALALSGGTASFVLSGTTSPANVVIAPGGILPADCPSGATPSMQNVLVTATQP